ncbi:MAG TPA: lipid A biosynthesis acyltransferase [Bacteroidetes bacterium]|nr:lipid A biosynthesis acyltransferase [Bacteroidota bacterium]
MKSWRHALEEKALSFIAFLMRQLPRNAALRFGEILGSLVYLIGVRTAVTRENLTRAYPEFSSKQIEKIARNCYRHFGALLAEFARLPLLHPDNVADLVEFEGFEVLDGALKKGRGGIVVSGHLGNWELMGASVAIAGYPVSYVVTSQQNPRVEALMDRLRESTGVQIIKRKDAIKGVLRALKSNQLVAILSDQDTHEAGVFVPFFGRPASTPRGAAMFCLRTGADLIFAESYRRGKDRLKVVCELIPRDDLPDDQDEAVQELTRRFTARLEEAVRRHPEQWFWMHRRWKTPPP